MDEKAEIEDRLLDAAGDLVNIRTGLEMLARTRPGDRRLVKILVERCKQAARDISDARKVLGEMDG